MRPKNLLLLGLLLSTLTTLPSCASQQDKPAFELELRQLELNGTRFIEALFNKQMDLVLQLSGYPFYQSHQAVLRYPDEWHQVLEGFFANSPVTPVQVISIQPMTNKELEIDHPRDLGLLMENDFSDHQMLLYTLQTILPDTRVQQQRVLLLVDRSNGKIVGYIQ